MSREVPAFDDDLGFSQRVKDLTVQQFVAHPPVEAFAISVLSGASWFNVSGLCPSCCDPPSDGLSNELWAIVRPDVGRNAPKNEQVGQSIDDLGRVQLSPRPDRQTFPAVFVQNV
jgi:hypothetical protein